MIKQFHKVIQWARYKYVMWKIRRENDKFIY